jgi:hypothetical protein
MSRVFQAAGYDVGHEVEGENGTSDWHAVGWEWPRLAAYDRIIHIVRDPLLSMRSLVRMLPHSWEYIGRFIPECIDEKRSLVERVMFYWLHWNRWARQVAQTRPIWMDCNTKMYAFPAWIWEKPAVLERMQEVPTDTHTRGPYELQYRWCDLEAVNAHLADQMYEDTKEYSE